MCGAPAFQWTTVHVELDAFDATSLVRLALDNASVATISSHNVLLGRSVGGVRVYLDGRTPAFAHVLINVRGA